MTEVTPAFWLGERGRLLETCTRFSICCCSSLTLQPGLLLSGHNLSHVAFSLPAPSSSWVGWSPSQICCGKSLELGLSKDEVVSVCRLLVAERCVLFVEGQWQVAFLLWRTRNCWAEMPLENQREKLQWLLLAFPCQHAFVSTGLCSWLTSS